MAKKPGHLSLFLTSCYYFFLTLGSYKMKQSDFSHILNAGDGFDVTMAHLGVEVQKEVSVCSGNTNCTNSCPLAVRPSLACLANTFPVHQPHPHPTSFGAMLIYYPEQVYIL